MTSDFQHRFVPLAGATLALFAAVGSLAYAQTPASAASSGPHAPEVAGLQTHTMQGLRHPAARSSTRSGVTMRVTPKAFGKDLWEFTVVIDSRRASTAEDLSSNAVLEVDGWKGKATHWGATRSGRRHREGVLTFSAPPTEPSFVEVRVQRADERTPRAFRWQGAALK